jgi:hypothetical protein
LASVSFDEEEERYMMDKWIDRERDEFVVIVVNIFAPLKR